MRLTENGFALVEYVRLYHQNSRLMHERICQSAWCMLDTSYEQLFCTRLNLYSLIYFFLAENLTSRFYKCYRSDSKYTTSEPGPEERRKFFLACDELEDVINRAMSRKEAEDKAREVPVRRSLRPKNPKKPCSCCYTF